MTIKDYEAIAKALYISKPNKDSYLHEYKDASVYKHAYGAWYRTVSAITNVLSVDNKRLNTAKFFDAAINGE